jgi:hypothetical protein
MTFDIPQQTKWIRATATFRCGQKEWDVWKMTQFRLHLMDGESSIRTRAIRVYRALHDGETQRFSIDLKIPSGKQFDRGKVDIWNADSGKYIAVDDLTVTAF